MTRAQLFEVPIYLFLSTLGNVRESYDEKKVTKGIQLNLLVSDTVMRQWCVNDRGVLILYKIGLANARKHFELINGRYTRSDSLATMRPENDPYWDISFKDHYLEIFSFEPPVQRQDYWRFIEAAQTTEQDFKHIAMLVHACMGDLRTMMNRIDNYNYNGRQRSQSFLVPGLIPRGTVTLLLADQKVGKSAVAMQLAVAVANREPDWLGFPVAPSDGFAVYLLGEDTPDEASDRISRMTGGRQPILLDVIPADGTEVDGLLKRFEPAFPG